jgi:hypothetical protein
MIWIFGDLRQLRKYEMNGLVQQTQVFQEFSFTAPTERRPSQPLTGASGDALASPRLIVSEPSLNPLREKKHIPTIDTSARLPDLVHTMSVCSLVSPVLPTTPTRLPFTSGTSPVLANIACDTSSRPVSPMSFGYSQDSQHIVSLPKSQRATATPSLDMADPEAGDLGRACMIEVSAAFYDEAQDDIFGAKVAVPVAAGSLDRMDEPPDTDAVLYPPSSPDDVWPTASFIPAYPPLAPTDLEDGLSMDMDQHIAFDFEGLPHRTPKQDAPRFARRTSLVVSTKAATAAPTPSRASSIPCPVASSTPAIHVSRIPGPLQACVIPEEGGHDLAQSPLDHNYGMFPLEPMPQGRIHGVIAQTQDHCHGPAPIPQYTSTFHGVESNPDWRLHEMLSVPAFASPLAPILSPVVARAQWEIVVRSALIAGLITVITSAGLIALPIAR